MLESEIFERKKKNILASHKIILLQSVLKQSVSKKKKCTCTAVKKIDEIKKRNFF